MKIGKHYGIQKVSKEDFSLLAENLDIKVSAISKILDDYHKSFDSAIKKLSDETKIDKKILESIASFIKAQF